VNGATTLLFAHKPHHLSEAESENTRCAELLRLPGYGLASKENCCPESVSLPLVLGLHFGHLPFRVDGCEAAKKEQEGKTSRAGTPITNDN